jgi:hypothetical protein
LILHSVGDPLIRRDFLILIGASVRCKWGISIRRSRENARRVKAGVLTAVWNYGLENTAEIFIAASAAKVSV